MSALRAGRFKPYCYILNRSESSFHVDIADGATVSELKQEILIKKQEYACGCGWASAQIWKVCMFELSNLNQVLGAEKHYMSTYHRS